MASKSKKILLVAMVAGIGAWQAMRYFEMSRLDATRRQLARLGIGDGDAVDEDVEQTPATAASTHPRGADTP